MLLFRISYHRVSIGSILIRVLIAFVMNIVLSFSVVDCCMAPSQANMQIEQFNNYQDHDERVRRIVDLVFEDMPESQKLLWRMLLLGTVATETNFLNSYSGRSKNGNGPYQIIGKTVYGIIHSYVSYPIKDSTRIAYRYELISLFSRATDGRVTWSQVSAMNIDQLRDLCVYDYDFAALISLLVYKEIFERKGIGLVSSNPGDLASLWKRYYNTSLGVGTEKRFIQRFMSVHAYFA